jgi:hypothetical protein
LHSGVDRSINFELIFDFAIYSVPPYPRRKASLFDFVARGGTNGTLHKILNFCAQVVAEERLF